jgi:hypothetical protein
LNAASGAKLWSYTTGGAVVSSPAVVRGVVYVGSSDGKVYAISAPAHLGLPAVFVIVVVVGIIAVIVAAALSFRRRQKRRKNVKEKGSVSNLV